MHSRTRVHPHNTPRGQSSLINTLGFRSQRNQDRWGQRLRRRRRGQRLRTFLAQFLTGNVPTRVVPVENPQDPQTVPQVARGRRRRKSRRNKKRKKNKSRKTAGCWPCSNLAKKAAHYEKSFQDERVRHRRCLDTNQRLNDQLARAITLGENQQRRCQQQQLEFDKQLNQVQQQYDRFKMAMARQWGNIPYAHNVEPPPMARRYKPPEPKNPPKGSGKNCTRKRRKIRRTR